ncbi:hypothetical protein F3K44_09975 [Bacillus megaterium]|nr:hypothetical protein [Priestia megaterium]
MKKGYSQINRGKLGEEKIHHTYNLTGGKKVESLTFVLFGATGDLAKEKSFLLFIIYLQTKSSLMLFLLLDQGTSSYLMRILKSV